MRQVYVVVKGNAAPGLTERKKGGQEPFSVLIPTGIAFVL